MDFLKFKVLFERSDVKNVENNHYVNYYEREIIRYKTIYNKMRIFDLQNLEKYKKTSKRSLSENVNESPRSRASVISRCARHGKRFFLARSLYERIGLMALLLRVDFVNTSTAHAGAHHTDDNGDYD